MKNREDENTISKSYSKQFMTVNEKNRDYKTLKRYVNSISRASKQNALSKSKLTYGEDIFGLKEKQNMNTFTKHTSYVNKMSSKRLKFTQKTHTDAQSEYSDYRANNSIPNSEFKDRNLKPEIETGALGMSSLGTVGLLESKNSMFTIESDPLEYDDNLDLFEDAELDEQLAELDEIDALEAELDFGENVAESGGVLEEFGLGELGVEAGAEVGGMAVGEELAVAATPELLASGPVGWGILAGAVAAYGAYKLFTMDDETTNNRDYNETIDENTTIDGRSVNERDKVVQKERQFLVGRDSSENNYNQPNYGSGTGTQVSGSGDNKMIITTTTKKHSEDVKTTTEENIFGITTETDTSKDVKDEDTEVKTEIEKDPNEKSLLPDESKIEKRVELAPTRYPLQLEFNANNALAFSGNSSSSRQGFVANFKRKKF